MKVAVNWVHLFLQCGLYSIKTVEAQKLTRCSQKVFKEVKNTTDDIKVENIEIEK